MNLFLIYVATICLSNAFGLSLINFSDQSLSREMKEKGYVKIGKGTMYKTQEGFKNFCFFFIPFYFTIKGIKRIQEPNIETIKVKIKNGDIYKINDLKSIDSEEVEEENEVISLYTPKKIYEDPLKYKAMPITSIYTKESDLSSLQEIMINNEKELNISPFIEKEEQMKNDIDIIPYLMKLDCKKLEVMKSSIDELIKVKKQKELSLNNKK